MHTVLGASGGAGRALVHALARRGLPVRALSRRPLGALPPGAVWASADALDAGALRAACDGSEAIYHCLNTPYPVWPQTLPVIMANVIGAAEACGARVVYCDNLYMYPPGASPMTEDTPPTSPTRKGRLRAALAATLLEAHDAGRVAATVGRASDFFGPGAPNTLAGRMVLPAALRGGRARWLGALDAPHTLNFLPDVGEALAVLGAEAAADGRIRHLPAAPAVTGRAFIEAAFAAAGGRPRMGVVGRPMLRLAGLFSPMPAEMGELLYQFEQPFVMASESFTEAFGLRATPLDAALAQTVAAERAGA